MFVIEIVNKMFGSRGLIWCKCCLLVYVWSVSASKEDSQPNIVFIMADDMGWNDVSYHGSDQIQTPNIDGLALQSVILQQYYSEAICTPARTALLTGKYPMRLGMHGIPLSNTEDRGIPLTERLLPSYLKELGYSTHLVGKWHVGMSRPEFLPTARGYDYHYGIRGGFVDYYTYNSIDLWASRGLMFGLDLFENDVPQDNQEGYLVDILTERAINIINQHNASHPLFLHVAHTAVHAGNSGALLQVPQNKTVGHRHIAHSNRRLYAELVTALDRSVGQIVEALAQAQMLDNTIIVFVSDNGAPTVGKISNWGSNLPFRGVKWTPWEGAVRVPAFIWHASISPTVWGGLMHITDWLPTLVSAAGGNITSTIDGINLWDSIVSNSESPREHVLLVVENGIKDLYAAYREGDYKIIIGNVTGLNNYYYGEEYLVNRGSPPSYYDTLTSSCVAKVFATFNISFDLEKVQAVRNATLILRNITKTDATLCIPTSTRGCLFNVRLDPMERHDLWDEANETAVLLTNKLNALWKMQIKRAAAALNESADPANFNYTWLPWANNI